MSDHTRPLTLDEIATLHGVIGPTRYRQQVISLFASGRATEAQWTALAACLATQRSAHNRTITRFQDRSARQDEWQAMATLVLLCSESARGDTVRAIDQAILAWYTAHEAGRDAWGRKAVG